MGEASAEAKEPSLTERFVRANPMPPVIPDFECILRDDLNSLDRVPMLRFDRQRALLDLSDMNIDEIFERQVQPTGGNPKFKFELNVDSGSVEHCFPVEPPGSNLFEKLELTNLLKSIPDLDIEEEFEEKEYTHQLKLPESAEELAENPVQFLGDLGKEYLADQQVFSSFDQTPARDNVVIDLELIEKPRAGGGSQSSGGYEYAKELQHTESYEPSEDIMQYRFRLDFFQRAAIVCLENREHVFVAAHTSAGKTVVAEWAIKLAMNNLRKAVYTSPIKALSNQKYSDFRAKFTSEDTNVGILTGDVQINPEANCLIMTTEILRSMLYLNSSVISEVDFVIFDEVHYISDEERGVVWEETLIMLPPSVCIVMLSATVGNAMQFANWVGGIKKRTVHVVSTPFRPVPLSHFLYTGFKSQGKKEPDLLPFLSGGKVHEVNIRAAEQTMKQARESNLTMFEKMNKLLLKLKRDTLLPVIVFVFSKKKIEDFVRKMRSIDLTDGKSEVWAIKTFIKSKLETVTSEYVKKSPQVSQLSQLLARGIGVHHSGILPILKEIVEMLFAQGHVKVLFATETFAMGVNMPAKSVIFQAVHKFGNLDNSTKLGRRLLKPSEYIQMAGRAGRRGLDDTGTVIVFCDTVVPSSVDLRTIAVSQPAHLRSHFQVTFSMILKICRSDSNLNIEDMMGRSFSEIRRIVLQERSLEQSHLLESDISNTSYTECPKCTPDLLAAYTKASDEYLAHYAEILARHRSKAYELLMKPGQVVVLQIADLVNTLGVILEPVVGNDRSIHVLASAELPKSQEIMTAPLDCKDLYPLYCESPQFNSDLTPCLIRCHFQHILYFSTDSIHLGVDPLAIINTFEKRARLHNFPIPFTAEVYESLKRLGALLGRKGPREIPKLDVSILVAGKNRSLKQHELLARLAQAGLSLTQSRTDCPLFKSHVASFHARKVKERNLEALKESLSHESLQHYNDYNNRRDILRRAGYLNHNDKLTLKGKVACQISVQEIPITEALFNNLFHGLSPPEVAAVLSVFVFQGAPSEAADVRIFVENIAVRQTVMSILSTIEEFLSKLNLVSGFGIINYGDICCALADTVLLYASKAPYSQVISSAYKLEELGAKPVQEGDIVRCLQRVEYLTREMQSAAFLMGDPLLIQSFSQVHDVIKGELLFSNSLYLQT